MSIPMALKNGISKIKNGKKELIKRKQIKEYNAFIHDRDPMRAKKLNGNKFTIVCSVFGVNHYIDKFISSIVDQSLSFENNIELLLVDDGSIDGSAEKCISWASKFPNNIKYIRKENGGLASARNEGLKHVMNPWVTFIDPDDFVKNDYFEKISDYIDQSPQVHLVVSRIVLFNDSSYSYSFQHPLDFKYRNGTREIVFDDDCDDIHLQVASSFLRSDLIKKHKLEFHSFKPCFEDAHFIGRYLLLKDKPKALIIHDAYYYYRKRSDLSSAVDTSWRKQEKYDQVLKDGYLDLLKTCFKIKGYVPKWAQHLVFYDLGWHFNYLVDNNVGASAIKNIPDLKEHYLMLLREIYSYIDLDAIHPKYICLLKGNYIIGIRNCLKGVGFSNPFVEVRKVDYENNMVVFYHCSTYKKTNLIFSFGGEVAQPFITKTRVRNFLEEDFFYEHIYYFKWQRFDELTVQDIVSLPFKLGRNFFTRLNLGAVHHFFKPKPFDNTLKLGVQFYRHVSQLSFYKKKFNKAWLIMDRDVQADDNAEHFYQYILNNNKEVNAWFVLRKESHDWERLKKKNFKLIEHESIEHKLALLNAEYLISSHADHYIMHLLNKKHYADLMKFKFIFLQHGVIKDDLSEWLNYKDIRYFVCAAKPEFDSIAGNMNHYKYTSYETILTGLPRHDALLQKKDLNLKQAKKKIVIMPTWRNGLVGEKSGLSNKRIINPGFKNTHYFRAWDEFLKSSELQKIIEEENLDVIFFPHLNVEKYFSDCSYDNISILTSTDVPSIQHLFVTADLLITDFSSVAFDVAYLKTPIIYYQFDADFVFNGGHITKPGYFSYEKNGFGPVCQNESELLGALKDLLLNDLYPSELYMDRMESFFPFRDGKASERIYNILNRK